MSERGAMMVGNNWTTEKLANITTKVGSGATPRGGKNAYKESGISLFRSLNVYDGQFKTKKLAFIDESQAEKLSNVIVEEGDVLLNITGASIARCCIAPTEFLPARVNQHVSIIRPQKDEIDSAFLAHLLVSKRYKDDLLKSGEKAGATRQALTKSQLQDFEITFPPLPEQKRIVAILDKAFAGIDAAVANTEKNLANARELFESYLNGVFTRKGDGWVEKSVAELADHCLGKMLDKQKNKGNFKPYLRNLNVRWFDFDLTDLLEMRFEASEEDRYSVRKGDVLICEGGYPGRAAIWPHDETINFQKALHRARFKEALHSRWFLFYLFLSDKNGNLKQYFTGAGIQHFTGQSLKRFVLPIAPNAEMERHLDKFESLQVETQRLESLYQQKLTALAELKQSILQKAFAGELTSHPEKTAEEAVA